MMFSFTRRCADATDLVELEQIGFGDVMIGGSPAAAFPSENG